MAVLKLSVKQRDIITGHLDDAYPEEGCGFLLGNDSENGYIVTAVSVVENRQESLRNRRYSLTSADYQAADRLARSNGVDVIGTFHSHPDHPARPSPTDLDEATFPGFVYMIVGVENGRTSEITAWTLADDRSEFVPVDILSQELEIRYNRKKLH